jgi:rhodanese-related sulfurtransferase
MPGSVKDMLAAANAAVPKVAPDAARRLIREEGALLVDVRDAPELGQTGKLDDAVNVSRGMLEFRADSASAYHNPEFRTDRPVILYCASGGRSALAAQTLQQMGYRKVYNLGGFKEAADAGFPTRSA